MKTTRPQWTIFYLSVTMAGVLPFAVVHNGGHVRAAAQTDGQTRNPHGDYKEDCSLCHAPDAWKPARISAAFDHEKFGVPLTGAHASVRCTQCHVSLDFAMAPTACIDCHADVHNGELGTDCARCHGTRNFIDRHDKIRMHRVTRFPLKGAHLTLDCEMCHRLASPDGLSWVNTPTNCAACHIDAYDATTNPNHAAAGFSQECESCHNEQTWLNVRFDHAGTGFALTGAHVSLACERCHAGGVYTGTPTACVACHQNDYDATTDPDHAAAGFPTDCASCHSTSRWDGARFDHSQWFPLYSGVHAGKWNSCSDCHTNGAVFADFSCLGCHPHSDQAKTDESHQGEAGYAYDSQACYTCHPQGRKQ